MSTAQRTAQTVLVILLTVLAVALGVYLVYRLSNIVEWMILAIFLAVAINPAVAALRKRGVAQVPAILLVFLTLLIIVVVLGALALPSFIDQSKAIIHVLQQPGGLTEQLRKLAAPLGLSSVVAALHGQIESIPQQLASWAGSLTTITMNTVNALAAAGTVIVFTFFMLHDGERLTNAALRLVPQERQPAVRRLLDQSARAVSGYVSGNLAISVIAGAGVFVGMTVLGVPYALALAVLLAVFDLIPLVGATLGAIPPILAAFGVSPVKALILLIYIIVYQQIESHVLNPLVYGRSVHLPGLAVILAVLIGGTLMGILGALIAIPVAEIIRLILLEVTAGGSRAVEPRIDAGEKSTNLKAV